MAIDRDASGGPSGGRDRGASEQALRLVRRAATALMIDHHNRALPGWHLSRSVKALTAVSALEHALIARSGTLGKVPLEFLLRPDNGLVFTSWKCTALLRSYALKQEVIAPHCPQNGTARARAPHAQGALRATASAATASQRATRAIGAWISFHNNRRPHQALAMRTPAKAFGSAA